MSIPKEPRQIMINLMYLVLTAMLALNVSNEILNAFKIINNSIGKSNESIMGKNNEILMSLQGNEDMPGHKERVKPFNDKAKDLHAKAQEVYDYLENWKLKIAAEADHIPVEKVKIDSIKAEDNIDASTRLLVENKGGEEIKKKLEDLKEYMLSKVGDTAILAAYRKDFPLRVIEPPKNEDNPSGDWSFGTFHNVPTLAAITLFAKMQNDIRNSESLVLSELSREAEAIPLKFDAIAAVAVPKTSYVMKGAPVEANIMFAAYNTSANPVITGSGGAIKVEKGVGVWKGTANGVGLQTVRGNLTVNLGDRTVTQPWSFQYMVGSAGASVQLDKMNVFYIGVDNPITVTAAGYSLEDVSINIPGANVAKTGNGKYNVNVTANTGAKTTAVITAKTAKGSEEVGRMDIRIKRIPDPVAEVAGKSGSFFLPANVFRAQLGVAAVLKGFDFDAKFVVTSFEFAYAPKRGEYTPMGTVNGPKFEAMTAVNNYVKTQAKIGDKIFIDNIKAIGPDKVSRSLGTIIITLN